MMKKLSVNKCFGGQQGRYQHQSKVLNCEMVFSVYLPSVALGDKPKTVPVLYWLSGLTCDDQNFVTKAGAQQAAEKYGIAIVCPDTSPRGDGVPDDEQGAWDFGLAAGFYVNATQAPWSEHYQMYDYVVSELPDLITSNFPIDPERASISGHSMGGHGALTVALNNPDRFKSVSAFSPIVSPINCPWGQKALGSYLGDDKQLWARHDTCELTKVATTHLPVLIDQGLDDDFLQSQLKTDELIKIAKQVNYSMNIRYQQGYDHSYFFIASFIDEHIAFHHQYLTT